LHHLVGHAAPQYRPALVHEAGEEGVCLVVGDSLLVVDAAVQGDVDAEGQESHGVLRSRSATRRFRMAPTGAEPSPRTMSSALAPAWPAITAARAASARATRRARRAVRSAWW